jgi:hypothetical protein
MCCGRGLIRRFDGFLVGKETVQGLGQVMPFKDGNTWFWKGPEYVYTG